MIVKHGQRVEGLEPFVRDDRRVMAKKMNEDFVIETGRGWDQGRRGDWLVHIGDDIWHAIEDVQFRRVYKPAECDGEDRRVGAGDRRAP